MDTASLPRTRALLSARRIIGIVYLALAFAFCGCGGGSGPTGGGRGTTGGTGGTGGSGGSGGSGGGGGAGGQVQITYLSPSSNMVGVPLGLIDVNGQGFAPDAQVLVDGMAVPTFYHGSGLVEAEVDIAMDLAPAIHQITVRTGTQTSNSATWTVYQPQRGPLTFAGIPGYLVADESDPSALVVADVTGDGLADAILPGDFLQNGGSALAILAGQRDGNLADPTFVPIPPAASLGAGDIDGNGTTDLVLLGPGSPNAMQFSVMLNDGSGNFMTLPGPTVNGVFEGPIVLQDVDGDGKPDILVKLQDPFELVLLRNLGGGSFGDPEVLATPSVHFTQFALADFNGDSRPDIIYTAQNAVSGNDEIHLLMNNGNGQFSDSALQDLSGVSGMINVGDFNGDGNSDIALQTVSAGQDVLGIFLGNGQGRFTGLPSIVIDSNVFLFYNMVVGDFDHDGHLDLAGVNGDTEPSHLLYLWGDGQGGFSAQQVVGPMGFFCAMGDINGDGIPDVVVPDRFDAVSVALGRKDRNYPQPTSLSPPFLGVSVGDADGDGLPDILVSSGTEDTPGVLYRNKGNGNFEPAGNPPGLGSYLVDLDGDGLAELVGFDGNIEIWPGTGDLNFGSSPVTAPAPNTGSALQFVDLDGDGRKDIIGPGMILYNRGNLHFDAAPLNFLGPFVVGDFNNDGRMDIATPAQTLLGSASGTFTPVANNLNIVVEYGSTPVVGDFNGDGILDVAAAPDRYVAIFYGKGDGTFYIGTELTGIEIVGELAAADFNGDGKLDLVTGLQLSQQLVLYTNLGNGQFSRSLVASGVSCVGMNVADLNGDRKPDVVLTNFALDFRPLNVVVMINEP